MIIKNSKTPKELSRITIKLFKILIEKEKCNICDIFSIVKGMENFNNDFIKKNKASVEMLEIYKTEEYESDGSLGSL
jgi:hypothetical protein